AAAALGCVYGGATVCAWYPITPSSSLAEAFTRYCMRLRVDKETGKNKFAIIQAEDELASIGIVTGAGWNGARAFTSTSGPGISLMSEFIGLAYFAEIPLTIIDVQRGGPSTGMPTRTQQADLLAAAYASHGDTKHPMLLPQDPAECFEHAAAALDLADRLQTPVFVMTDLDIGSTAPAMDEALVALAGEGIHLDAMRLRAFPFADAVREFIATHDHVFVVEQNRDAQMRTLLINELEIDPSWLIAVLHYDGT